MVGIETEKVSKEKATADKEKVKVSEISKEVTIKQRDCAEDLKKAEPALIAAQEALNTLNKSNLTELKSFGSPPGAVVNVTAAVMVLMAHNGKVPKDRSWAKAKAMMAKVWFRHCFNCTLYRTLFQNVTFLKNIIKCHLIYRLISF